MGITLNSIKNKFILAILIASFIPFGLSIFYVFTEVKKQFINQIINNQKAYIQSLQKRITKDFLILTTNIKLWSSNQILEDILVDDIDKRIQKYILNLTKTMKGDIIITNHDGKVVSSSLVPFLGKILPKDYIETYFTDLHKIKYTKDFYIKISQPIFSNIDNKRIGYFIVLLKPDFFEDYTVSNNALSISIFHKDLKFFVGKKPFKIISISEKGIYDIYDFIFLYTQINKNHLKNWFIILQLDKSYIFNPIKKVEFTFVIIFLLGSALILFISLLLTRRLVKPIEELTDLTVYISKTKDYNRRAKILSSDEIGLLAKSFNRMIAEIQKAHKQIEKENTERLKLFTKLIDMINKISSLKKEEEMISVIASDLKTFLNAKDVIFTDKKDKTGFYVKVEGGSINGYIYVDLDRKISNEEKNFLESIGKMLSLYFQNMELLRKSQEASRAKTIFLSNISHELKTPLNSIIGFAQLLKFLKKEDNEILKIADSIEISGKHLLEIINDILELIKIESNAVRIKKKQFNVNELINEVITIIKPLVEEKGLQLILDVPDNLIINTDYRMLKQIILNILSNGVKFTEKGYIKIHARQFGDKISFRITDTGIGIEKDKIDKLFLPFVRLEPVNKYEGTGLGLVISKNYAKLLGGDIMVYSKGKNRGSTFEILIPIS